MNGKWWEGGTNNSLYYDRFMAGGSAPLKQKELKERGVRPEHKSLPPALPQAAAQDQHILGLQLMEQTTFCSAPTFQSHLMPLATMSTQDGSLTGCLVLDKIGRAHV